MKYWLDTEFIEHGRKIDLVSIGVVAEDDRELYMQLTSAEFEKASDWVWRNVMPHLRHFDFQYRTRSCHAPRADDYDHKGARCVADRTGCPWRHQSEATMALREFCDPEKYGPPEFWGYFADYDWVAICQLFGEMSALPKGWPMYCHDIEQLRESMGNPELPSHGIDEHDALADARWNRTAYYQLMNGHMPSTPSPKPEGRCGSHEETTHEKSPRPYVCSHCGAAGVRLWRQSHVFLERVQLLCLACAESNTGHFLKHDQIGELVPAVPTPDGLSFWGYTSVPQDAVDWWYSLPIRVVTLGRFVLLH